MFAKGRSVDPNDPTLLLMSAVLARALGREQQSIALFHQTLARDPLQLLARRYLARTLAFAGRLPEAEIEIRQVLDMNPAQTGGHYDLGRILLAKGETDLAATAFKAETDPSWRIFGLPLAFYAQHRTSDANAALAEQLRNPHEAEFQMAETYAYFGDADQAFKWLDAAAERDLGIMWLRDDPLLKALKSDPRYATLFRKLNFSGTLHERRKLVVCSRSRRIPLRLRTHRNPVLGLPDDKGCNLWDPNPKSGETVTLDRTLWLGASLRGPAFDSGL